MKKQNNNTEKKPNHAGDEEKFRFRDLPSLLKETYKAWNADKPFRLGAVVAYYAVLSLPALLVIIINAVGAIWGEDIVQGRVTDQIAGAVGQEAADSIRTIIANTQEGKKSVIATIVGIAALLFGATGVFYHLQISINEVWEIRTDPQAGILKLLIDRARGFAFVLVIGFLMLISFVITAAVSALNDYIRDFFPDVMVYVAYALNFAISFGTITVLFALIFKYLPDAEISWKMVWIGAIITTMLFMLGEFLLGLYFGKANPGSAYGAAGSLILILLWVSYSCIILFFGVEFTYIFAKRYGKGIIPSSHAMHVEIKEVVVKKGVEGEDKGKKKK